MKNNTTIIISSIVLGFILGKIYTRHSKYAPVDFTVKDKSILHNLRHSHNQLLGALHERCLVSTEFRPEPVS